MPISFKISKKGKKCKPPTSRLEPKPIEVIELSDGSSKDRFEIVELSDDASSDHRFGVFGFDEYNGEDGNVADLIGSSNSSEREPEVSFILNLYANGYSVLAPENDNENRAAGHEDNLNRLRPYDQASESFFTSIEYGAVPTDIPDDIPCKFLNGAITCEVRDHRKCISNPGSNIGSSHESPTISKVQLKMHLQNVVLDLPSMVDESWNYENYLEVEARIVNSLKPTLDLDPRDRFGLLSGNSTTRFGMNLDIPNPRKRRLAEMLNRASSSSNANVMQQDLHPIPENDIVHIPENAFAQEITHWEPVPIFPQGASEGAESMNSKRARTEPRNNDDTIQPQPSGSFVNSFQSPGPVAGPSMGTQYSSISSDAPFGQTPRGKTVLSGPIRVDNMDDLMATSSPSSSAPQRTENSIHERFSKIGMVAKRHQLDCKKNNVDQVPNWPPSFSDEGLHCCLMEVEACEENIIEDVIQLRLPGSPQLPPVETETFDSSQAFMSELLSKHLPRTQRHRPDNLKPLQKPEGDMSPRSQQMDPQLPSRNQSPLGIHPSITQHAPPQQPLFMHQMPPQPQAQLANQPRIMQEVPPQPQYPLQNQLPPQQQSTLHSQPTSIRNVPPQQQSTLHNQPTSIRNVPPQQQSPFRNHQSNMQQLPIQQQFGPLQNQPSIARQMPPQHPRNNSMPQSNAFVPHQHTQASQMQRAMMVGPETHSGFRNIAPMSDMIGNIGQNTMGFTQSNAIRQHVPRVLSPQQAMMVGNPSVAAQQMQRGGMPRMRPGIYGPLNQQHFQQQQHHVLQQQHARWPSTQGNPQQQFAAQQQGHPQQMGQWTQPVQTMRAANPEGYPVSTTGSSQASHTPSSSQP